MERVPCNLCGSEEHILLYQMPDKLFYPQEVFNVVQCTACGLGFVNPRPTFSEIQRYYPKAFFDEFKDHEEIHVERYRREEKYLFLIKRKVQTPYLLDIGCADGGFLRYLYHGGWHVEGVEPFITPNEELPFVIHHDWFPNIDFGKEKYDVITAWAVLEHVHDPMAYFSHAASLLKTDGCFIFLVNNLNSLQSRFLYAEDPPRHLYFYSEKSIRMYLKKVGLRLIKADYTDRIYQMSPRHWLEYFLCKISNRDFRYPPPPTLHEHLRRRQIQKPTMKDKLHYALDHPVGALDAFGVPLITQLQKWFKVYGNTVYVAQRVS